jgi:hypothetical protein
VRGDEPSQTTPGNRPGDTAQGGMRVTERSEPARFAPSCSRPINEVLIFGEHGEGSELARAAGSGKRCERSELARAAESGMRCERSELARAAGSGMR